VVEESSDAWNVGAEVADWMLDWANAANGERARAEARAAEIDNDRRFIRFLPSYGDFSN
jgi:hypothetical protein